LSDDEDDAEVAHPLDQTDPTGQVEPSTGHASATDDAEDTGKTSAETVNPDPVVAGARISTRPPTTDRVQTVPASGARGQKSPQISTKQSNQGCHATQVITQIELPPYHGPQSPLDPGPSEIVFGHIFEAFHQMSQAKIDAAVATLVGDDNPLPKRTRMSLLMKKISTPKYAL
jgi:hypothetical protein